MRDNDESNLLQVTKSIFRLSPQAAKRVTPGSGWITFLLLWIFIVPGLIYWIWRHTSTCASCSRCGSKNVIPTGSPVAQDVIATRPLVAASLAQAKQERRDKRVGVYVVGGLVVLLLILAKVSDSIEVNGGQSGLVTFLPLIVVLAVGAYAWRRFKKTRPGA
jgi:hypothetical protein